MLYVTMLGVGMVCCVFTFPSVDEELVTVCLSSLRVTLDFLVPLVHV